MAIDDGDVLKVVVSIILGDDTITQGIYHFLAQFISTQTDSDVLDALETFVEDLYGELTDEIASTCTMDVMEVDVVEWSAVEDEWITIQNVGERNPTAPFINAGEMLPNQMAATFGAYTVNPTVRGRKSIPGFGDDTETQGELDTAALVALGLALAEYLSDLTLSVNNTLSPGVASSSKETFRAFGSGWINDIMGTQRRRKRGVGA